MDKNTEQMFTGIYKHTVWGFHDGETVSGPGSTINYTKELRKELPKLFKQFNITSVLDAPCGDFNWMRTVMKDFPEIQYTGADIVEPIIQKLQQFDTRSNQKFIHLDITQDKLPDADLMICRDCLFHFEPHLVGDFVHNFVASNIKYLLTTTHYNDGTWSNISLNTGGFHPIDLLSEPYNFDSEVLYSIDDWIEGYPPRRMCLWSAEQIKDLL